MKGKPNPNRVDKVVYINAEKMDAKIEELLDEFEQFDFTYRALLTQGEFEEKVLPIIRKLFRRINCYALVVGIFDDLMQRALKDQHKFLTLIDFMVNLSKYDPTLFKDLPNDIIANVSNTPMFSAVHEFIYNKGRMNYRFKKYSKKSITKTEPDEENLFVPSDGEEDTPEPNPPSESASSDEDSDSDENSGKKVTDVSLAELTRKILSKTTEIKKKPTTNKRSKASTNENYDDFSSEGNESDNILDEFDSEADENSYDEIPGGHESSGGEESDDETDDETDEEASTKPTSKRAKERTTYNSLRTKLEDLVESDSDGYSPEDETDDHRKFQKPKPVKNQKLSVPARIIGSRVDDINSDDVDPSMNSAAAILEHMMDFNELTKSSEQVRHVPKRKTQPIRKPQPKRKPLKIISENENMIQVGKLKIRAKPQKLTFQPFKPKVKRVRKEPEERPIKKPKIIKPVKKSPVKKKAFLSVEHNLDFLYSSLEFLLPKTSAKLIKNEVKGFSYKPAQYSIFKDLPDDIRGVDGEIAQYADNILNILVTQLFKRCAGNDIDEQQFVHPFEYNYIMDNFDAIRAKGTALPPMILQNRFSSLFDYGGAVNEDITMLNINDTKVKGLLRLRVFESEDEYFGLFKKIVPRDKVGKRLEFLNKLVTDGRHLYIFDFIDPIQEMMADPRYQIDSEIEEEEMIEKERQQMKEKRERIAELDKLSKEEQEKFQLEAAENTKDGNNTEPASIEKDGVKQKETLMTNVSANEKTKVDEPTKEVDITVPDSIESSTEEAAPESVENEDHAMSDKPTETVPTQTTSKESEIENSEEKIAEEFIPTAATQPSDESQPSEETVPTVKFKSADETNTSEPEKIDILEDFRTLVDPEHKLTSIELEHTIKMNKARVNWILKRDRNKIQDERTVTFCSSKGIRIPIKTVHKVLSTKEIFEYLAFMLFPRLKIDSSFEGIQLQSIRTVSFAYNQFRPYLLSMFVADIIEFLKIPRYFRLDAIMFELQLQDLLRRNTTSTMKSATFHA